MKIPFNKPLVLGSETEYLKQAIDRNHFSGKGEFTSKCAELIEKETSCQKDIMTPSCTSALEMCALLCNIKSGDEVIMPSFTHPGTANPFVRAGAEIVWCDIKENTKNIDENKIEPLITDKTKAVVAVHYGGVICRMDKIATICKRNDLFLIEDAAMSIGSRFKDQPAGSFGDLAVISFHKTKNVQCGEGGALLINKKEMIERAEFLRDYGTNRIFFEKGLIEKYTWVEKSSNFSMSELQAAFLYAQFKNLSKVNEKRNLLFNRYLKNLSGIIENNRLPVIPNGCLSNGHCFYIHTKNERQRKELIDYLKQQGIQAVFHYQPLHKAAFWQDKYNHVDLPTTDFICDIILRLPMFYSLTIQEVDFTCSKISEFYQKLS